MDKNITEERIYQIVEEVVNKFLKNEKIIQTFKKRLDNLSLEQIDEQFYDCRLIQGFPSQNSKLYNKYVLNLNETADHSESLEIVKKEIMQKYRLREEQFQITQGENGIEIAILAPFIHQNCEMIESDMETMGYFMSRNQLMTHNGYKYKIMQFEPMFQNNIRDKISQDGMLYHITPSKNVELIKEKGFIPSCKNNEFKYPNRIYFFTTGYNITELRNIARGLRNSNSLVNENESYSLIVLNLYKVPQTVGFHYDPNFLNAVFTYDNVPSNSIVNILDLKI